MTYKQKTRLLGIPVLGYKDGISPEIEMRKWQLVENLLMAATRSLRNCIFEEGVWTILNAGGKFNVTLGADAIKLKPSISGVMKGIYFAGGPTIQWEGLEPGKRHFLYLAPRRGTRLNPQDIRHYSRLERGGLRGETLVAVFDSKTGKLDKHPSGKVYAESMSGPGEMLKPVSIEFESAGEKGFVATATRKIVSVQVSRLHTGDWAGKTGEVAIGYYGKDPDVEDENQAIIYNDGDTGILLNAVMFCG
jgi:hypothetical protein